MSTPYTALTGPKQGNRQKNLDLARRSCFWSSRLNGLTRDWAELTYTGDPTLNLLLEEKALISGRSTYHGVNTDPSIIATNRLLFPDAQWHTLPMEAFINSPSAQNVGVLIYDGCSTIASPKMEQTVGRLIRFAKRQERRLGGFLLSVTLATRSNPARSREEGQEALEALLIQELGKAPQLHSYQAQKGSQEMLMFWVLLGPIG